MAEVTSARSSPAPDACPECDTAASVTSDLHKYQVACTCKPASAQYACADDPGPPPPAKTDTPPALPPRPPTSVLATRRNNATSGCTESTCRRKKYAWWCCGCGALAAALGGLLAAQHILLRAYTASPHHLETVPAAVPAAMLVLTGVCIMSLARRRNRYSYMIKVVGACCLVCALTCVLVTITTTVIHMNKLQTLKFCEYTKLTRTCSCFSMPPDSQHITDDDGVRCVFEGVKDCGVVHGALYWCLRGVFALSVTAVLVCIFSCMLAYQLLSHERKKMYWEQLELRCRSLYRPPTGQPATSAARPTQNTCSCCTQCHTAQPAWDFSLQHRFWAPGRIGNLYSPNPGSGRKTSPWSWFPWPRGNSQNSRCRMDGVPQSGDSAYGFCETDQPQNQQYDERSYPSNFNQFQRTQSGNFGTHAGQFQAGQFQTGQFQAGQSFQGQIGYQEGFSEGNSSFDAQTGVWGPPPPYSPQGRSGSRHHLHHQDPATTTLLHHHHIDVHRSNHEHANIHTNTQVHTAIQPHTCPRNSYHTQERNPDLRLNPELVRLNPELVRLNPELVRLNPELVRLNPELVRLNPELVRLNPELAHLNPDFSRMNQEYPQEVEIPERFNTLRGHLVPYRNCPRSLGLSAGNLHRDCREETIECVHQKTSSKVSDQSSDSCQKLGKENLAFQNDKQSPIRSSMQDCHRGANQNTESEVYFADVSSCCNADCCVNPNISALVGTIENHPESTSESDTGSFTLTRSQRPQPQVGSKRRPRLDKKDKNQDKRDLNNSIRLAELNNAIRNDINNSIRLGELNNSMRNDINNSIRLTEHELNNSMRMIERNERIERFDSRDRLNDSRHERCVNERLDRSGIERIENERMNDSRIERCERIHDSRMDRSDRMNDSRIDRSDCRLDRSDRMNDSRIDRGDRMNDSRIDRSDRSNDSRLDRSDRINDSRIDRSERMNDSRIDRSDRMNDSRSSRTDRISDVDDSRDRLNDSRIERISESSRLERVNDSRMNDVSDSRVRMSDRFENRRMSDLNSSMRIEGSPKTRPQISPLKIKRSPKSVPKDREILATVNSPLFPNTEESLLSDEDKEIVYSNEAEAKCLGPDSQYEPVREKEELKTNHHHCYSDTNTMDSGWQSGSEKQVTD